MANMQYVPKSTVLVLHTHLSSTHPSEGKIVFSPFAMSTSLTRGLQDGQVDRDQYAFVPERVHLALG
jgi:hypothetical protein